MSVYKRDFPTVKPNHQFTNDVDDKGYYYCTVCNHRVKIKRDGKCIGVNVIHNWNDVPDNLATKTKLRENGLQPAVEQLPAAAKAIYTRKGKFTEKYYPLYEVGEAESRPQATPAQLRSLEKARHMSERLHIKCSKCSEYQYNRWGDPKRITRKQWIDNNYDNHVCSTCKQREQLAVTAQSILDDENGIIIDTETTDLHGEIIEIAVINMQGETLLDQRIKPKYPVSAGAYGVHGIATEDLANEPTFDKVYPKIKEIIAGRNWYIYNYSFDTSILNSDIRQYGLECIKDSDESACIMELYAEYVGDWSNYWKSYKWQPLTGGDHTALGDCLATLDVIKRIVKHDE